MTERKHPADTPPLNPLQVSDQADLRELVDVIRKLSIDLHALKGSLAANTSLTLETLEKQQQQHVRLTAFEEKLTAVATSTSDMTTLFEAGRKGVGFFQGAGRLLFRLASWLRPILIAGGIVWGLMHGQWPKGGE
jgi:hypothetical protein